MTSAAATPKSWAVQWQLSPGNSHHVQQNVKDGFLEIVTTGNDPYIVGRFAEKISSDDRVLELEYFSTTGISDLSVIVGPPINEKGRVSLPPMLIAEGWQTYSADLVSKLGNPLAPKSPTLLRFDLGNEPDARIQIRNVRLRPRNERELVDAAKLVQQRNAKVQQATQLRKYLKLRHDQRINAVSVTKEHVLISVKGDSPDVAADSFELTEHRPYQSIVSENILSNVHASVSKAGELQFRIERFDDGYDRVNSAWRLKRNGTTARRYADEITTAGNDFAAKRHEPKNQKGLSGLSNRGPRSDFSELGIKSVTVNLSLNQFVSQKNGPNRKRIPVPGPPVYFNPGPFAHYDQNIDFARKHDIVVSAIVLIPCSKQTGDRHPLIHPENDGGTYAMPDLTTPRSVAIYTYVLNEIAKRYRNHEKAPGGITNWIVHNEIDFHTIWTNMGQQPRELVTEHYYRSMRLIHNVARQYNPYARVFASLTHHWNVPDDGRWQRLAPRELLETLQRYSEIEGDFAWGVAYHPYPQSLFAKVAWEDKKVSNDFDTQLITIQNLQVLGRFLKQPAMLATDGNPRPVILSEQGYHTDSYDDEAQNRQAGSLAWTMRRLESMPWVESFIYHRWIDHPAEGGLMLGLRTLPSKEHPHGQRKRSWHVYQAIGTEKETELIADLPGPKKE